MNEKMQLLEQIEQLEKETVMTLAIYDPKKYKTNMVKIKNLQSKLRKLTSFK